MDTGWDHPLEPSQPCQAASVLFAFGQKTHPGWGEGGESCGLRSDGVGVERGRGGLRGLRPPRPTGWGARPRRATFQRCRPTAWQSLPGRPAARTRGLCRTPTYTSLGSQTRSQNLGLLGKPLLFRQPPADWPLTQAPGSS